MTTRRVVVGHQVFRFVSAQDPPEGAEEEAPPVKEEEDSGKEMVKELREGPAENWRKFLQPIIINVRNKYGLETGQVSLVGPRVKTKLTTPRYGFSIEGHIKFLPEAPDDVVKDHGLPPYAFEAAVTPDGELISSVKIIGSEG